MKDRLLSLALKRAVLICPIAFMVGCQSTPTATGVTEEYLEALRSGNTQSQQQLSCLVEDPVDSSALTGVKDWEIVSQETKTDDSDSNSQYELMSVKIESTGLNGASVSQLWEVNVWKSDDLFEFQKRLIERLNQVLVEGHQALEQSSKMTGNSVPPLELQSAPERTGITANPFCITKISLKS